MGLLWLPTSERKEGDGPAPLVVLCAWLYAPLPKLNAYVELLHAMGWVSAQMTGCNVCLYPIPIASECVILCTFVNQCNWRKGCG